MDPFNAARRELLRFGGIGLAAAATTAMPAAYAAAQRSPNTSAAQGIFDIRTYGAVGDGKAVDSPAINNCTCSAWSHHHRAAGAIRESTDHQGGFRLAPKASIHRLARDRQSVHSTPES